MLAVSWVLRYSCQLKCLHMAFTCDLDFSYESEALIECLRKNVSKNLDYYLHLNLLFIQVTRLKTRELGSMSWLGNEKVTIQKDVWDGRYYFGHLCKIKSSAQFFFLKINYLKKLCVTFYISSTSFFWIHSIVIKGYIIFSHIIGSRHLPWAPNILEAKSTSVFLILGF